MARSGVVMERQGQGAQAVSFILRRVEAGLEGNTYTMPGAWAYVD